MSTRSKLRDEPGRWSRSSSAAVPVPTKTGGPEAQLVEQPRGHQRVREPAEAVLDDVPARLLLEVADRVGGVVVGGLLHRSVTGRPASN